MKIRINDRDYELAIEEVKKNKFKVSLEGKSYFVEADPYELKHFSSIEEESSNQEKEKKLKAPFPGVISQVTVNRGMSVKKNQALLILTSMKMENEIVAPMDGVVQEILVRKDQEVKEGQELLFLKAKGSSNDCS